MSRIASPGENVSFAVTIGTILSPDDGCDHFEVLRARQRPCARATRAHALDRVLDLVGVRADDDEDLLDAGEREALERPVEERGIADREQALPAVGRGAPAGKGTHARLGQRQRHEARVEAVCEDDRLQHLLLHRDVL
jgi:hypothetical protein